MMATPVYSIFAPQPLQSADLPASVAELRLNSVGLILDWNGAAEALLDLSAEQVLGYSAFDLLPDHDPFLRAELLSAFKHATERFVGGVKLLWRRDNGLLTLEFHAIRDRSGDLSYVALLLSLNEAHRTHIKK